MMGTSATGKHAAFAYMDMYRIANSKIDEVARPERGRFRIRRGGNGLRRMACCSDLCSKTRRHDAYFSQLDRAPTIREDPPCRNHHWRDGNG
jgi:hypothetical protein